MRICFLVGSLAISGGTYVILQHAAYLRRRGHSVTLAVQDPITPSTLTWHDETNLLECISFAAARKHFYDLVIATWWKTALEIATFQAECRAYFVQSIESRFYPAHDQFLRRLVESTYDLPMAYVTEAQWIRDYLRTHNGQDAALIRNGIRKDIYTPLGRMEGGDPGSHGLRVLVEGPLGVPFKNTALALKLARRAGIKDLWLLTGSPVSWLPGVTKVFSQVPMVATAPIYRACDVLLKLSTVEGMFGPPLEMFHCGGTALVFDVTGHEEYIRHNDNALVVKSGDTQQVVSAIQRLGADRDLLWFLKEGARLTAIGWPSWEESSHRFEVWLHEHALAKTSDTTHITQLISDSVQQYSTHEQARRRRSLSVLASRCFVSAIRRLPRSVKRWARHTSMIWEVVSPQIRVG